MSTVGEDLDRVAAGLRLVLMGLAAMVVNAIAQGVVLAIVVVGASEADPGKPPLGGEDVLVRVANWNADHPTPTQVLTGVGVLAVVLGIAGKVFCLAVPAAAEAASLVLVALGGSVLGLALRIAGSLSDPGDSAVELATTSLLCSAVGYLFFVRFLRRLAIHLGSAPLVARVARVQVGTMILGLVLMTIWLGVGLGAGNAIALLGLFAMIGFVVVFQGYARAVFALWQAVGLAAETAVDD